MKRAAATKACMAIALVADVVQWCRTLPSAHCQCFVAKRDTMYVVANANIAQQQQETDDFAVFSVAGQTFPRDPSILPRMPTAAITAILVAFVVLNFQRFHTKITHISP